MSAQQRRVWPQGRLRQPSNIVRREWLPDRSNSSARPDVELEQKSGVRP